MIKNATPSAEHDGGRGQAVIDNWLFRDRESVEKRFGMEMERVLELRKSKEGQRELLQKMHDADPSLNGDAKQVLETVNTNIEQLKKKESFLMKMVKMPVRAVQAVGRTIRKHPVLSGLGAIAILAALIYFFGPAATSLGEVASAASESFKNNVLGKIGVPTPGVGMGAAADLPVTGGLADGAAAAATIESPGMIAAENAGFIESARIPEQAVETIQTIADEILKNPNVQDINPTEQFFDMLDKAPK